MVRRVAAPDETKHEDCDADCVHDLIHFGVVYLFVEEGREHEANHTCAETTHEIKEKYNIWN